VTEDPVKQLLDDPRFKGKPVTWEVTPEEYDAVRRAFLTMIQAGLVLYKPYTEDVFKAQVEKMLGVYTKDCVMELAGTGERWVGHDGATAFYRAFLGSFSGMDWAPEATVIGPQGVMDIANMTGTLEKPFAWLANVGDTVHLQWVFYFPWSPEAGKLKGETIYSIRPI
jgi:SnoaL-like domain